MRRKRRQPDEWRRRFALLPIEIDRHIIWLEYYEWRIVNENWAGCDYEYRLVDSESAMKELKSSIDYLRVFTIAVALVTACLGLVLIALRFLSAIWNFGA